MDRLTDALIDAAATQVPRHGRIDIVVSWIRRLPQKRRRSHDLSRLAVAALRNGVLYPGTLNRMAVVVGQAFDRCNLRAHGTVEANNARPDSLTVEMHRARAALRNAAAEFRTGKADVVA
jgi:hypothetical protein